MPKMRKQLRAIYNERLNVKTKVATKEGLHMIKAIKQEGEAKVLDDVGEGVEKHRVALDHKGGIIPTNNGQPPLKNIGDHPI